VIYYSNNFDLEKRLQSEDRAHRIGQENKVTYVDLVCKNTIDEKIVSALRSKLDLAQEVLGDEKWKDWLN
jgi:SNF2 family DNA or RNA helicase